MWVYVTTQKFHPWEQTLGERAPVFTKTRVQCVQRSVLHHGPHLETTQLSLIEWINNVRYMHMGFTEPPPHRENASPGGNMDKVQALWNFEAKIHKCEGEHPV